MSDVGDDDVGDDGGEVGAMRGVEEAGGGRVGEWTLTMGNGCNDDATACRPDCLTSPSFCLITCLPFSVRARACRQRRVDRLNGHRKVKFRYPP